MDHSTSDKAQLRTVLRRRRGALAQHTRELAAQQLPQYLQNLPGWDQASHIALYEGSPEEISTRHIRKTCLNQNKRCYIPVVRDDGSLDFAHRGESEAMEANRFGIPEPGMTAERRSVTDLDIVFLPLVGWDRSGTRLGMGGGYYDRALEGNSRPLLVGLAFSAQECERIPREDWDIALDAVMTESGVYICPRSQID